MKINSIRFKAGILYSSILCLILTLFGLFIYFDLKENLYKDLDDDLVIKAKEIVNILNAYEKISNIERHPHGLILKALQNEGIIPDQRIIINDLWKSELETLHLHYDYINIINSKGQPILISENIDAEIFRLFANLPLSLNNQPLFKNLIGKNIQLRAISLAIPYKNSLFVIRIATPLKPVNKILNTILSFMVILIGVLLFITSFTGELFARNVLMPVVKVTNLADKITYKDLSTRIPENESDEEMRHLIKSFNTMIDRLNTSFNHISEFSSHVAHELKTPLAIIRGEIELALDQDRTSNEYKKTLKDCLSEIERMIRIIKDLLLLSKLDFNPDIFQFERINLTDLMDEISEHSKILAMNKHITVNYKGATEPIFINGDKVHLRRLFLNIIHNAIKFTPAGKGIITIAVKSATDNVSIDIVDTGVGIPEEFLGKVFEKFFRAHKDIEQTEPGSGLGLSIALAIAKAHQGHISVQSQPDKGSTFTVTLPII